MPPPTRIEPQPSNDHAATLLAFARPVLDNLPQPLDLEEVQDVLLFAASGWNLAQRGRAVVAEALAGLAAQIDEALAEEVAQHVARWRAHHTHDARKMGSLCLEETDGRLVLVVYDGDEEEALLASAREKGEEDPVRRAHGRRRRGGTRPRR